MSLAEAEYLPLIGRSLSVPEKTAANASLQLVAKQYRAGGYATSVRLWGKVCGYQRDYLIAQVSSATNTTGSSSSKTPFFARIEGEKKTNLRVSSGNAEFQPTTSLYSLDGGAHWIPLPQSLTALQNELCDGLRGPFLGDPAFNYKVRHEVPAVQLPVVSQPPERKKKAEKKGADGGEDEDGPRRSSKQGSDEDEEAEHAEEEEELEEQEELNRMLEEQEEENEGNNDDGGAEEKDGEQTAAGGSANKAKPNAQTKPTFEMVLVPETVRLSHFIHLHDYACALVPRGEFIYLRANNNNNGGSAADAANTIKRNNAFPGLSVHDAMKLSSYLRVHHLPSSEARNQRLYGPTYNALTDFLSSIADDHPRGVWSVKYDAGLNVVAVRNLYFEGSLFWYRPGTSERGQIYYGSGERNLQLGFMIP